MTITSKLTAFVSAGLLAVVITGCSSEVEGDTSRVESSNDLASAVVTIQYDGKPLDCITWDGSHGETGLACDFAEYHADANGNGEFTPETAMATWSDEQVAEFLKLISEARSDR